MNIKKQHPKLTRKITKLTGIDSHDDVSGTLAVIELVVKNGMKVKDAILKVYSGVHLYLGELKT